MPLLWCATTSLSIIVVHSAALLLSRQKLTIRYEMPAWNYLDRTVGGHSGHRHFRHSDSLGLGMNYLENGCIQPTPQFGCPIYKNARTKTVAHVSQSNGFADDVSISISNPPNPYQWGRKPCLGYSFFRVPSHVLDYSVSGLAFGAKTCRSRKRCDFDGRVATLKTTFRLQFASGRWFSVLAPKPQPLALIGKSTLRAPPIIDSRQENLKYLLNIKGHPWWNSLWY